MSIHPQLTLTDYAGNKSHLSPSQPPLVGHELGEMWDVADELIGKLEELTCPMYAAKSEVRNVNYLIYHLFGEKKAEIVTNCHLVKTV